MLVSCSILDALVMCYVAAGCVFLRGTGGHVADKWTGRQVARHKAALL